ncbi:hypothetical protein [Mycobacterium sp. IDR2000157661]|uniref:hypothetical protein n=1 Tax=Mycobacterium sp. IDR2000157661 TaxID=2867005 RepID=UPI001EEB2D90|nr:hypothetical protein [Mycobacterium sp. IDR2000157661]ULE33957.1 hypothetical protein K3G64_04500 [Mycobacterium sp. IDR2000157661]
MIALLVALAGAVVPLLAYVTESKRNLSPLPFLMYPYFVGTVLHVAYWTFNGGRPTYFDLSRATGADWQHAVTIQAMWMALAVLFYLSMSRKQSSEKNEPRTHHRQTRALQAAASGIPDNRRSSAASWDLKDSPSRPVTWSKHYSGIAIALLALSAAGVVLALRKSGVNGLEEVLARPIAKRRVLIDEAGSPALGVGGLARLLTLAAAPTAGVIYYAMRKYPSMRTRPARVLLALFAVVSTVSGMLLGSRSQALFVWALLLVIMMWTARKVRVRRVVVVVLALAVTASIAGGIRSVGNEERVGVDVAPLAALGDFASGREGYNAAKLAAVRAAVPEVVDYMNGRTYLQGLAAPVPRSLWPDKPNVRLGPEYGATIFGLGTDRITGRPPGLLGEAYLNFGLPGLALAAALVGWLFAWVRQRTLRLAEISIAGGVATAYVMLHTALSLSSGDFVGFWFPLLRDCTLALLISWALIREPHRKPPNTTPGKIVARS